MRKSLEVPDELSIPVSHEGLAGLIDDLADLDITGVKVVGVKDYEPFLDGNGSTQGPVRSYVVELTKGELFSLINQHALNMLTAKYL